MFSPYTYTAQSADFGADTGMICASNDDQYIEACTRLLANLDIAMELGKAGRRVVELRYSYTTFKAQVRDGLIRARLKIEP